MAALRRARLASGLFLGWTTFVWIGRIRNASTAPDLDGLQRLWPILLAGSFLVPAMVLAVTWVGSQRRGEWMEPWASILLRALAGWTVVVWVLRIADIVLGGEWSIGFVAVHSVLAALSVASAAWAVLADRAVKSSGGPTSDD